MKKKATRHTSLTDNGAKVCKALRRGGFSPHPGPISARSGRGGQLRIKVSSENGRTRIRVAGGGVQEIFLYGLVDIDKVVRALDEMSGSFVIESVVNQKAGSLPPLSPPESR
ncbi:MAG: hypothetical protein HQL72_00035 [Magnetococcales bacterium]|nr:hypothetical protein [Magnetococcales bacterium]